MELVDAMRPASPIASVLHHVLFESAPVDVPFTCVEDPVDEAVRGRIRHGKGMMRVVMGEKPLPAIAEHAREFINPGFKGSKVPIVSTFIDRICVMQALDVDRSGLSRERNPGERQILRNNSTKIIVRHRPISVIMRAWEFRAERRPPFWKPLAGIIFWLR